MADDAAQAVALVELLAEGAVLADERALLEGPLDHELHLLIDDGLGQVVVGTHLDGFDRALNGAVARDHDDHGLGVPLPDDAQ